MWGAWRARRACRGHLGGMGGHGVTSLADSVVAMRPCYSSGEGHSGVRYTTREGRGWDRCTGVQGWVRRTGEDGQAGAGMGRDGQGWAGMGRQGQTVYI